MEVFNSYTTVLQLIKTFLVETPYSCSLLPCDQYQSSSHTLQCAIGLRYLYPLAMVLILRVSSILDSLGGRGRPTPQACERMIFSCNTLCTGGIATCVLKHVHTGQRERCAQYTGERWGGEIGQSEGNVKPRAQKSVCTYAFPNAT